MKKIGFLGFGKMAMAIVAGWKERQLLEEIEVFAYAPNQTKLAKNCLFLGAQPCADPASVCKESEAVILACKPAQVEEVLDQVRGDLKGRLVICLAAGISYEKLENWISDIHHVSIMPNTAMAAGAGIVIVEKNNTMDEKEKQLFEEIFAPLALIETVDPKNFSIAGTISGCWPAFLGLYAEALADAGVKYGLSREVAARISARAVYGAGAMLIEEGREPSIFKNEICSPGGTTIRGIVTLEKDGFRKAVIEAIEAIQEK